MNSEERQLISDLFARMQSHGPVEKDRDAATLIAQYVRTMPDAPYMLVQSVLVQEMALQQANQRIEELEARVADLERAPSQAASAGGGSFLGGLFGGARPAEPAQAARGAAASDAAGRAGSVPSFGGRPGAAAQASPWNSQAAGAQPGQAAGGGGGGFMRSAMATAAGVAGGMLLADGIRNMMGSGTDAAKTDAAKTDTAAANDTSSSDQADYQDADDNDPGVHDAGHDSSDFGSDFGEFDV